MSFPSNESSSSSSSKDESKELVDDTTGKADNTKRYTNVAAGSFIVGVAATGIAYPTTTIGYTAAALGTMVYYFPTVVLCTSAILGTAKAAAYVATYAEAPQVAAFAAQIANYATRAVGYEAKIISYAAYGVEHVASNVGYAATAAAMAMENKDKDKNVAEKSFVAAGVGLGAAGVSFVAKGASFAAAAVSFAIEKATNYMTLSGDDTIEFLKKIEKQDVNNSDASPTPTVKADAQPEGSDEAKAPDVEKQNSSDLVAGINSESTPSSDKAVKEPEKKTMVADCLSKQLRKGSLSNRSSFFQPNDTPSAQNDEDVQNKSTLAKK